MMKTKHYFSFVFASLFLIPSVITAQDVNYQKEFDTFQEKQQKEYKEFKYTPSFKRQISIIDPETTEEIKPTVYFDEEANEVRGKCKLKANKPYFAFEIKDKKD